MRFCQILYHNTTISTARVDIEHYVTLDVFDPSFLIDCFEATATLQAGNLNLSRARITPLALYLLLPILLSTKGMYPTLKSVLDSRQESQSAIVCHIFKHLVPLHRSEGVFTVGPNFILEETNHYLHNLATALRSTSIPTTGLLSEQVVFDNFIDCVACELEMLANCEDRQDFVSDCLDLLAPLPQFLSVGTKSWDKVNSTIFGMAPNNAILGLRKLFWVGDDYIGCAGKIPDPSTIYLFRLLIERSFSTIGINRREMGVASSGISVIGTVIEKRQSMIRIILESVLLNGGS